MHLLVVPRLLRVYCRNSTRSTGVWIGKKFADCTGSSCTCAAAGEDTDSDAFAGGHAIRCTPGCHGCYLEDKRHPRLEASVSLFAF